MVSSSSTSPLPRRRKFDTLVEIYKSVEIGQCMIFANKKERVIELANKLKALNFVVSETHGDMEMVMCQTNLGRP